MAFDLTHMLNCAALGVCLFAISSAATRLRQRAQVIWLISFFTAHLFGLTVALADGLESPAYPVIVLVAIPALLVYSPSLHFYVRGLTGAPAPDRRRLLAHFSPAIALAVLSLLLLSMPAESRAWIGAASEEPASPVGQLLRLALVGAMAGFIIQALVYAGAISRRLSRHRNRLKDLFASTEERELGWISLVTVLLVAYALQTPLPVLLGSLAGLQLDLSVLDAGLSLALVWTLGLWGLRQAPVVASPISKTTTAPERYARSTLPAESMVRIAQKIEQVVAAQARYTDPDLSLRDLSAATGVSSNHLSQTLNAQMGERFFDYVNRHRIAAAKQRLRESDDGVAAILHEVGFNSRSAFYRAFRRETGESPAAWRRATKVSALAPESGTQPSDPES